MLEDTIFTQVSPCNRPSIQPYCDRVKQQLSPKRFEHVMRVTQLADTIGRANDFSEDELRITAQAAMLHDIARELSPAELFELAPPQSPLEEQHPMTLHGRAGRALAEKWGVHDERVLEAIEGHVFGVRHENRIGMAVYIADVSEPGRGVNDDIRELAMSNLFKAYQQALDSKVCYLQSKGKAVHPVTLKVHFDLCKVA